MAKFIPDEHGDVACIHCRRVDNIHRKGPNELIGVEPENGLRMYIHSLELDRLAVNEFELLYAARSGQALRGMEASSQVET